MFYQLLGLDWERIGGREDEEDIPVDILRKEFGG